MAARFWEKIAGGIQAVYSLQGSPSIQKRISILVENGDKLGFSHQLDDGPPEVIHLSNIVVTKDELDVWEDRENFEGGIWKKRTSAIMSEENQFFSYFACGSLWFWGCHHPFVSQQHLGVPLNQTSDFCF